MGFKRWISDIWSNGSTNCATITHLNKMYPTVKLPTFGTVVKRVKSSSSNPSPGIIQRKVYEFFVTILNANRLSFNLIKTSFPPPKKNEQNSPKNIFIFSTLALFLFLSLPTSEPWTSDKGLNLWRGVGWWGKSAVQWVKCSVTRRVDYFSIFGHFSTIKLCPTALFAKVGSKYYQMLNKAFEKLPTLFIFCKRVKFLPNLVTLD